MAHTQKRPERSSYDCTINRGELAMSEKDAISSLPQNDVDKPKAKVSHKEKRKSSSKFKFLSVSNLHNLKRAQVYKYILKVHKQLRKLMRKLRKYKGKLTKIVS